MRLRISWRWNLELKAVLGLRRTRAVGIRLIAGKGGSLMRDGTGKGWGVGQMLFEANAQRSEGYT